MGATLSEKTKFEWPVLLVLLGGAAWLTTLHWNVSLAVEKQKEIKADFAGYQAGQVEVLREIARIQGKLNIPPMEKISGAK